MDAVWTAVGAAVAAVAPFVVGGLLSAVSPRVKHMRRLSELLAVYDKMPEGRAKQALDEVVHRQLAEVRARYMTAFKREDPGKLGKALIGVGLVFYFVGLFGVAVLDARGDREAGSDASVMFAAVFALGLIVMGFGAWRGDLSAPVQPAQREPTPAWY